MKTRFHRLTGRFLGGLLCLLLALLGSSPVIAEKSVTVTFYHTDVLGSVIATSDEFGHLQWRRDYQPYGEIQLPRDSNDTDTRTNSLGYTGKPRDPNGLVYLGARYYDPLAGRFMAVDPAGVDASNPHSFNRYAYAHNNPYKYVDPDGEFAIVAALLVAFTTFTIGNNAIDAYHEHDSVMDEGISTAGVKAAAQSVATDVAITGAIATAGVVGGLTASRILRNVTKGGDNVVDGYRAVSKAEADDIAKHGFRPNPNGQSMQDKWFSETRQGAEKFKKNYSDLDEVVKAKVPRDVYERSYKHSNIDNTGPGFCVACDDLSRLKAGQ